MRQQHTVDQGIDQLLNSVIVARWLGVDRSTLSRWRAAGTGPRVVWLSATMPRYRRADVESWLRGRAA